MSTTAKPPVFTLTNWPVYAIKIGLSSTLALIFVNLAQVNDPISATFVAAVCTSPTVVTGIKRAAEQMIGSLLGGAIAFLLLLAAAAAPPSLDLLKGLNGAWILGLSVGLSVYASGLLQLRQANIVAAFSALYMVLMVEMGLNTAQQNFSLRLAAVVFGGLAAMIVNWVLTSFAYRGVFKRRLHIAQRLLAWALQEMAAGKSPAILDEPLALISELRGELGDAARERRTAYSRRTEAIRFFQQASEILYEITLTARCASLHEGQSTAITAAAPILRGESPPLPERDPLSDALRRWDSLMNKPGT